MSGVGLHANVPSKMLTTVPSPVPFQVSMNAHSKPAPATPMRGVRTSRDRTPVPARMGGVATGILAQVSNTHQMIQLA